MSYRLLGLAALAFFGTTLSAMKAYGQVTCIQQYVASSDARSLGFAPSDVESLVTTIAGGIGLSPQGIKVIPCSGTAKVEATYLDRQEVPKGEYILYNPIWVREVIGIDLNDPLKARERYEAIFLFGHELGHLFSRHWTANESLSRLEKETEADRFAGCAAGALGADWQSIADFISRIRGDVDTTYPSRVTSLAVAQKSFDQCKQRGQITVDPIFKVEGNGPEFSPPRINRRTLDGCLVSPGHPNGDDCSVQATQTIASRFCKRAGYLSSVTFSTLFTPEFKASYKLTKKILDNGLEDFIWNEDDAGGFIINRVVCRRE